MSGFANTIRELQKFYDANPRTMTIKHHSDVKRIRLFEFTLAHIPVECNYCTEKQVIALIVRHHSNQANIVEEKLHNSLDIEFLCSFFVMKNKQLILINPVPVIIVQQILNQKQTMF